MGDAGILRSDERVELIDGELIDMAPIGSKHAGTVAFLAKRLEQAVGDSALVFVQNPLALAIASEPLPDIMLLKPRADFYRSNHPGPEHALLIVEVADTTLAYDRDIKVPLYAHHDIPEVWLVDLENNRLHVYTSPSDTGYLESHSLARPGLLATAALPSSAVDLGGAFLAQRPTRGYANRRLLAATCRHCQPTLLTSGHTGDMVSHMKTTIQIPDSLLEEARVLARQERTTLKALIEQGLRRVISERKRRHGFRLRKVTFKGNGLQPHLAGASRDQIRELSYEGRGG